MKIGPTTSIQKDCKPFIEITHFITLVSFDTPPPPKKRKTSEKKKFSDIFRGYRKRLVAQNSLITRIILPTKNN